MFNNRPQPETVKFGATRSGVQGMRFEVRIARGDDRPVGVLVKPGHTGRPSVRGPEWQCQPVAGYEYLEGRYGTVLNDAKSEIRSRIRTRETIARQDAAAGVQA